MNFENSLLLEKLSYLNFVKGSENDSVQFYYDLIIVYYLFITRALIPVYKSLLYVTVCARFYVVFDSFTRKLSVFS